jgi:hypothetical protein
MNLREVIAKHASQVEKTATEDLAETVVPKALYDGIAYVIEDAIKEANDIGGKILDKSGAIGWPGEKRKRAILNVIYKVLEEANQ